MLYMIASEDGVVKRLLRDWWSGVKTARRIPDEAKVAKFAVCYLYEGTSETMTLFQYKKLKEGEKLRVFEVREADEADIRAAHVSFLIDHPSSGADP